MHWAITVPDLGVLGVLGCRGAEMLACVGKRPSRQRISHQPLDGGPAHCQRRKASVSSVRGSSRRPGTAPQLHHALQRSSAMKHPVLVAPFQEVFKMKMV